jgi:ribosomal protein L37E
MRRKKKDEDMIFSSLENIASESNEKSKTDCSRCSRNYNSEKSICRAFPHGIPKDIVEGKFQHDKIYPRQLNLFIFEEK